MTAICLELLALESRRRCWKSQRKEGRFCNSGVLVKGHEEQVLQFQRQQATVLLVLNTESAPVRIHSCL